MKPFLAGQSREALSFWAESRSLPKFRAGQICQWLYGKTVISPDDMANLPKDLRAALKEDFFAPGSLVAEIASSPDGVEKLAINLYDDECIEMVIIPAKERLTF